ncbi:MAG: hypothetical protein H0W49_05075 [Nitrospirales bacterium]|nr:hypothetical protein [Nitrospirales bacterium]
MNRIVQHICHVATTLAFFAGGPQVTTPQVLAATDPSNQPSHAEACHGAEVESMSSLVLQYAEAMAAGRVEEWASLDLGCLARQQKQRGSSSNPLSESVANACWEDTLTAHQEMVSDEPESGIFGAMGRGTGFGLIHESHQHADFWKDYPPAIALSPAVFPQGEQATLSQMAVAMTQPPRPGGLILVSEENSVEVQVREVHLLVTYPNPMVAPLALRPGEPWWASGVIRRYGPVRTLLARFFVVSGLRNYGYAVDQAIVNEALVDAPQLAQPGSPGILPESPKWWDRDQSAQLFEDELRQSQRLDSVTDRLGKYRRLLLLDPNNPALNAALGNDLYRTFLREGMVRGGIGATDEATQDRLVELYWNLQAQTWRQEFTEVATGHSRAADAFFAAFPALEIAVRDNAGTPEMKRILGVLYRWNNDSASALRMHEELLEKASPTDQVLRGQLLSEIAWDRVQWLSWNRRYDHPWLPQAREEAKESLRLSVSPLDKLVAAQASLIIEALSVPRDQARLQASVEFSRSLHDQILGIAGVWPHLIGNDLVKALVPEGTQTVISPPVRSSEVMDTVVHHTIQDHNMFRTWDFDQDTVGSVPSGFTGGTNNQKIFDFWQIAVDSTARSAPQVLTQTSPCLEPGCFRVLLADTTPFEQADIVVNFRQVSSTGQGEAGIVLSAKDNLNFYAVTVNPGTGQLSLYRIKNGKTHLLGTGQGKLKKGSWHVLRVQVVNSAHVDHPRLEVYLDGYEAQLPAVEPLQSGGQIGLITTGELAANFDRFHAIEMITSRPLSKPAAY